jgi:uncharacterized membrane protein
MNGTTILVLLGAVAIGLGGGYAIVEGWLPWELALAALLAGLAYLIYRIRAQVREVVATQSRRLRRKKAPS